MIVSEGWQELPEPQGPFLVEQEDPPDVFFDDYDLAVISMYEPDGQKPSAP